MREWDFEGYDVDSDDWILLHSASSKKFNPNEFYKFDVEKRRHRLFFDHYRFVHKSQNSIGNYKMGFVNFDIFGMFV